MLTTLVLIALLTPMATLAVRQAQTALLLQRQIRVTLQVFYVAEAGLARAYAEIEASPAFDRLLLGPDGIASTDDDGEFPFAQSPPEFFPKAPYHYEVTVEPRDAASLDIVARGFGPGHTSQAVAATIMRSPAAPAMAMVAGWRELF